ncbi:MAG TPA: hypothetical protein VI037_08170 [Nitrososphaera sp.]
MQVERNFRNDLQGVVMDRPNEMDIVEIMYIPLKIGDSKIGLPKVDAPSLID